MKEKRRREDKRNKLKEGEIWEKVVAKKKSCQKEWDVKKSFYNELKNWSVTF